MGALATTARSLPRYRSTHPSEGHLPTSARPRNSSGSRADARHAVLRRQLGRAPGPSLFGYGDPVRTTPRSTFSDVSARLRRQRSRDRAIAACTPPAASLRCQRGREKRPDLARLRVTPFYDVSSVAPPRDAFPVPATTRVRPRRATFTTSVRLRPRFHATSIRPSPTMSHRPSTRRPRSPRLRTRPGRQDARHLGDGPDRTDTKLTPADRAAVIKYAEALARNARSDDTKAA